MGTLLIIDLFSYSHSHKINFCFAKELIYSSALITTKKMSLKIICTFRKKKIDLIVENYIEIWDSELQHSMVGRLNKLSKSLLHLSDPVSSTPFGDIVLGWLFSLQLLCPASALAIVSHWYSVPQILKAHSSLHSSLCPKSHFGRAFLHSCL